MNASIQSETTENIPAVFRRIFPTKIIRMTVSGTPMKIRSIARVIIISPTENGNSPLINEMGFVINGKIFKTKNQRNCGLLLRNVENYHQKNDG